MARFDLYANPIAAERKHTPYVLDVQNEYLEQLASRIVIPLRLETHFGQPVRDLNPVIEFKGKRLVLDTANLATLPGHRLSIPVDRLDGQREAVLNALDTLFGSF